MKKLLIVPLVGVGAAALAVSTAGASTQVPKKASLTIVHVQKGCHVFTGAAGTAAALKLSIARGGSVTVLNQDIDGWTLIEKAGPAKFTSQALKMNDRAVFKFAKPGVYTFATKSFDWKGMPEAKTIGPDNVLRLTVRVS